MIRRAGSDLLKRKSIEKFSQTIIETLFLKKGYLMDPLKIGIDFIMEINKLFSRSQHFIL